MSHGADHLNFLMISASLWGMGLPDLSIRLQLPVKFGVKSNLSEVEIKTARVLRPAHDNSTDIANREETRQSAKSGLADHQSYLNQ